MVWFRAWLETRSRIAFTIAWLAVFVGILASASANRGGAPGGLPRMLDVLAFVWVFVPVWLAGSGVRTQAGFGRGATRGLHGSTYFTVSLPVTRARLVIVRTLLGLIETAAVITALGVALWLLLPVLGTEASVQDGVGHLLVAFVCGLAFYGLSTLTATLLDDVWHIWSSTLAILVLWSAPVRRLLPEGFDVFRPLAEASPLVTHTLPWTAMLVALIAGGVFLLTAVKVAQAQEY